MGVLVLMILTTVGATLSGFQTVKSIFEKRKWIFWALLTGVLIFAAAYIFFRIFCRGSYT